MVDIVRGRPREATMHYEKLDVYQAAIQFLALAAKIMEASKREYSSLIDQLRRASTSIPLNIGEAAGKPSELGRKRFFANARGSAMECNAILDVLRVLEIYPQEVDLDAGKELLNRIVGMLTKLCR
jgi:four helix bundle protein